jgi:urate oxidase
LTVLGGNRYGKSGIRLVTVDRGAASHQLTDLTVDVTVEGRFADAYVAGDNAGVLPTDTMRGTVYALAGQGPVGEPEAFGDRLASHFLDTMPDATLVRVDLAADPWARIQVGASPHPHAFTAVGGGRRTASVTRAGTNAWVVAGISGLVVLKTTGSAFEGFLRDRFTTLQETSDRILATEVAARWRYRGPDADWSKSFEAARRALLETFAGHDDSRSLQHTLYVMGEALLGACPEVDEVRLVLPNRHHVPVDLAPYGMRNQQRVFVATDRPFGVIQGELVRPGAPPAGRAWG